jgi:hypothetical protein
MRDYQMRCEHWLLFPYNAVVDFAWGGCVSSTNTAIEWTDKTWNPTVGCNKVSPGCKHCYAETLTKRFHL